jgi:hypothetical protein
MKQKFLIHRKTTIRRPCLIAKIIDRLLFVFDWNQPGLSILSDQSGFNFYMQIILLESFTFFIPGFTFRTSFPAAVTVAISGFTVFVTAVIAIIVRP